VQGACQKTLEAENIRVYLVGFPAVRKILPTVRKADTAALIAKKRPWATLRISFILLAMVVVAPGTIDIGVVRSSLLNWGCWFDPSRPYHPVFPRRNGSTQLCSYGTGRTSILGARHSFTVVGQAWYCMSFDMQISTAENSFWGHDTRNALAGALFAEANSFSIWEALV
jgi:hypothetical protein